MSVEIATISSQCVLDMIADLSLDGGHIGVDVGAHEGPQEVVSGGGQIVAGFAEVARFAEG